VKHTGNFAKTEDKTFELSNKQEKNSSPKKPRGKINIQPNSTVQNEHIPQQAMVRVHQASI
jgi:hypothetical protein